MPLVDKKVEELWVVETAQASIPWFPMTRLRPSERPDFVLHSDGKTIALELTRYHQAIGERGSAPRAIEQSHDRTLTVAQSEFERRNPGVHLYVYPHWRADSPVSRSRTSEVAIAIAQLVESMLARLEPGRTSQLPSAEASYEDLRDSGLDGLISSLSVYQYDRATYGLWASPEAGYVSQNVSELEQIVRAKEVALREYRGDYSEYWLLIYSLNRPSGAFDVEAAQSFRLASTFDVVIFLDAVSRRYAMLKGPN